MTRDDEHRFRELAAAFVYLQRSPNTQSAYRRDLDGFATWCRGAGHEPLTAQPSQLADYREACEDAGASQATVARRLSALSSFFAYATSAGAVASSPLADQHRPVASPSPTTDLDDDESEALLATCALMGPKTAALVGLLLVDGLKLSEVIAADVGDLLQDGGITGIRVVRHDQPVDLALDPQTCRALAIYLGGRATGPLLQGDSPTRAPARLTRFGADYLLKRAAEAAGIGVAVSANTLRRRHVAASHAEGQSVEEIQERLGHRDARTTRRHLDDESGEGT